MIDFVTVQQAKDLVYEFIDKKEKLDEEFGDGRLLDGLVNGFTIKEALIIHPALQTFARMVPNLASITDAECEQRLEETCENTVSLLNILLLANVNVGKPASEHLTQSVFAGMPKLSEELKIVLAKIKDLYDPELKLNDDDTAKVACAEDFWA